MMAIAASMPMNTNVPALLPLSPASGSTGSVDTGEGVAGTVDDVAPGPVEQRAGEPAVEHAQRVGACKIQFQVLADALGGSLRRLLCIKLIFTY